MPITSKTINGPALKGREQVKRNCFVACLFVFFCLVAGGTHPRWASGSDSKKVSLPEMAGWKLSGEIETFSPENLYEYINGASDLYLAYDFQELNVAEYENEKKATVTIDVYQHKTPYDAFGIYSQERFPSANFFEIGAQGYGEKDYLNFVTGTYYVKISSFKIEAEGQDILVSFAKKVAENLGEKGALPSILKSFPGDGKIENSEKFIARKFLGYPFLHSAFTADYNLSGKKFTLFIIEGADKNECSAMIQKYLQEIGRAETNMTEGRYTVTDPHHGEVDLYWKEGRIWGALNLDDPALRSKYLKLVEEELQKRK